MLQIFFTLVQCANFLIVIFDKVTFTKDILFNVSLFTPVSESFTNISNEFRPNSAKVIVIGCHRDNNSDPTMIVRNLLQHGDTMT